jgi:hypothetical protein
MHLVQHGDADLLLSGIQTYAAQRCSSTPLKHDNSAAQHLLALSQKCHDSLPSAGQM